MKNFLAFIYGWFRVPFIFMSNPTLLFITFIVMLIAHKAEFNFAYYLVSEVSRWIWQYNDLWIRNSGPFFTLTMVLVFMSPLIVFHVFERSTGIRRYYNELAKSEVKDHE